MIHIRTIPKPCGILFPGIQLQMMTEESAARARSFQRANAVKVQVQRECPEERQIKRVVHIRPLKPTSNPLPKNVSRLKQSERKRLVLNRMRVR